MIKRFHLLLITIIVLSLFAIGRPAQAAFSNTHYSLTCTSLTVSGTSSNPTWFGPNTIWVVIFDYTAGHFVVNANVSTGSGGSFSYSASFSAVNPGDNIVVDVWDGDGQVRLADTHCTNPVPGPPLPAGFALKTITCDVAVFDAPGGQPVGSNMIKGGQTWYVNPTPKKDAAGKEWTEIFVGGYTNGFVPTSCVH